MTHFGNYCEIDWDAIGEPDCHEDVSVRIAGCDSFAEETDDAPNP